MANLKDLEAYLTLLAMAAKPIRTLRQIAIQEESCAALRNPKKYRLTSKIATNSKKVATATLLARKQIAWLQANNTHMLHFTAPEYPAMLQPLADAPAWLFCRGNPAVFKQPCLGIVGSRAASQLSEELTQTISKALAKAGVCIVSGLAKGIDTSAHKGALQVGTTAAVFGSGLDQVYPAENRQLAKSIMQVGACISEYPPMTAIRRHHFPERNRIIAGLCKGIIVTEAGVQSGSLITARLAAESGREVFVVPGNIWNTNHQGCHKLIQNGAKLVQSLQDIIEDLPDLQLLNPDPDQPSITTDTTTTSGQAREHPKPQYSAVETALLAALSEHTSSIETLAIKCQLSISVAAASLCTLEIEGAIIKQASGYRLAAQIAM